MARHNRFKAMTPAQRERYEEQEEAAKNERQYGSCGKDAE